MKTVLAIAALTLAGAALAAPAKAPPAPGSTPAEIVAARKAGMMLSAGSAGGIRATLEKADSIKSAAFAARGLAAWGRAIPGLFPASTKGTAGSRAKPEIWTARADFESKAAALAAAADKLAAAAAADDKVAAAAAATEVAGTCKSCHDAYQAPPPPRPAT
jgi:cytochrome c556